MEHFIQTEHLQGSNKTTLSQMEVRLTPSNI